MRRVLVFRYKDHVRVPDYEAVFHQWGVAYEEFENGAGNFTVAIVERDDGTIEMPCAHMIQFLKSIED